MTRVVLVARQPPRSESLARIVSKLREAGAEVMLISMADVERTHADVGAQELRSLRRHVDTDPAFYRACRAMTDAGELWEYVQRDATAISWSATATILAAVDTSAVYSVWELGRLNPDALLRHGAVPALEAFLEGGWVEPTSRAQAGSRRQGARARGRRLVRGLASSSVAIAWPLRLLWRPILTSRRLDAGRRVRLCTDVVARMFQAGRLPAALTLRSEVASSLARPADRADLLGGIAGRLIESGTQPPDLRDAVDAELRLTDSLYARGEGEHAASSMLQATRLAFHQGVHLSGTTSPLADDPSGFTEPFRSSAAVAEVARPRGRRSPAAAPPSNRPPRVLIATHGNPHFVLQLENHLAATRGAEVRTIDLSGLGPASMLVRAPWRLLSSLLVKDGVAEKIAEQHLRELLDWADIVFIDWCTALVRVFNLVDPGTTRVVVRLHSFEAFTPWPHLIDPSRIDDLVFVSEHVKDVVVAQVPALLGPAGPRMPVIPNAVSLRPFVRPKEDDARFTIGLIGYQVVAKDPRWAIEVLRRLRSRDERYRLRLIGRHFDGSFSRAAEAYAADFERELGELESEGAVERYGHTTDLPTAVEGIGVVLCSSVREGSPVAILEATASGAVPVVRDWPFFRRTEHGPRTMYPPEWVVDTPEEAAARILEVSQDAARWRAASAAVSETVLTQWDLAATEGLYDQLLFG